MPAPDLAALGAAALVALVGLVLARWRDLAPAAASLGAAALLLGPSPDPRRWAGLAGVAALVAAGQWRAARDHRARPELTATVVAVGLGAVAIADLARLDPGVRTGLAGLCSLVGLVTTGVSLTRLGAHRPEVRWLGEIPVAGVSPPKPPSPAAGGG